MIHLREETPEDAAVISALTTAAFEAHPHSAGTEAAVILGLRASGQLRLSLVAESRGSLIGHIAFSPVTIGGTDQGWVGLGPVSVARAQQGIGIGSLLIREGLARVRAMGAKGCVVLGEPGYYQRFGFEQDPKITYLGVPADHFQALSFRDNRPEGQVAYAPAFG